MKREEYMGALKSALTGFDEELVQEIISDYEERFRIGAEKGKTEEQVVAELGNIKDLVDELSEMQQGVSGADKSTAESTYTEEKEGTYSGQSGTYYQDKSFTETFDSAMKKFGKVFDKVMKEAGRVIEDAAEKIEFHFEEAKRNHYNNGDYSFTYESSERDENGEPNVEQSGEGMAETRRVVVDAILADVTLRSTQDATPKAVCHYYSHKTAMMYPFYTRQEGDTFYVGVRRNQDTEKKSGFFQINMSPSIEIEVFLPAGVVLVEGGSTSGDFELDELSPAELMLHTKSGDINAHHLVCDRITMDTMSGDINLRNTIAKNTSLGTKSGDCNVEYLEGVDGVANLNIGTASGDASVKNVQAVNAELSTASGDIDAVDCSGEFLEAGTASGDISVKASFKKYSVNTSSGEIRVESFADADVIANSTSGDVDVSIVNAQETYQVAMHSVSGDSATHGQTNSPSTVPTRAIDAKTVSGDINVRFL